MFTLKYGKLYEIEKKPYTYGSKRNKKILKRIECSLPELMTRNLKLGQELKNKITISSYMNDTETKTKRTREKRSEKSAAARESREL